MAHTEMTDSRVEYYHKRFSGRIALIDTPPAPNLLGVIVIPCFCEPHWENTLQALVDCLPTNSAFEVIMVVNASAEASHEVLHEQKETLANVRRFAAQNSISRLRFHALSALELSNKQAGVGTARKIGMDEALHRLNRAGQIKRGFIVNLDADCQCDPNYLLALEDHFRKHPKTPGCNVHFEHPMTGEMDPEIYEAIIRYELHLRYYVEALRYAGFPYAYHTIGSSMAVRAPVYMAQGGMNRKKAGEDFYFLNKIIPLGGYTELTETTVYPSPRPSDRVPFGTGRAVSAQLGKPFFHSYAFDSFLDLHYFFKRVTAHDPFRFKSPSPVPTHRIPSLILDFIESINGWSRWQTCIQGTQSYQTYLARFFRWFDGFQCMKYIHFSRDNAYGKMEVSAATQRLLRSIETRDAYNTPEQPAVLLKHLRAHQRKGWDSQQPHLFKS
jgi:hypothetical protein